MGGVCGMNLEPLKIALAQAQAVGVGVNGWVTGLQIRFSRAVLHRGNPSFASGGGAGLSLPFPGRGTVGGLMSGCKL